MSESSGSDCDAPMDNILHDITDVRHHEVNSGSNYDSLKVSSFMIHSIKSSQKVAGVTVTLPRITASMISVTFDVIR